MQPDATHIHKHSHTLAQDRRYRARFSYKFPMGEHQTPPVVWRSSPLFPHPPLLSLSPSLALCSSTFIHSFFPSFLPSSCISHTNCVFLVIFSFLLYLFNHWHLSRNVPFMWDKLSLCGLNVTKCHPVVLIMVCVWLHVCAAMRLDSSSQDCWAMKRVMMHTTSCIYTHQAHKYHHSHRLGPSTWSHSLGLRGRGEHGQSWQELLVCVCAKVYICSLWTCLSRLPSESIWPFTAI